MPTTVYIIFLLDLEAVMDQTIRKPHRSRLLISSVESQTRTVVSRLGHYHQQPQNAVGDSSSLAKKAEDVAETRDQVDGRPEDAWGRLETPDRWCSHARAGDSPHLEVGSFGALSRQV